MNEYNKQKPKFSALNMDSNPEIDELERNWGPCTPRFS